MPPSAPEETWWTDYVVFVITFISASVMLFNFGAYLGSMIVGNRIPILQKKSSLFFLLISASSVMWQTAAFMTHNHFKGVANKVTTHDCIFWYFYAEYFIGFGLYISIVSARLFRFYRMKLRSCICGGLCDTTLFFMMNFLPILFIAFLCSVTKCCVPGEEKGTCKTDLAFIVSLIIYIIYEAIIITTIAFLYKSNTHIIRHNEWPIIKRTLIIVYVIFPCVAIVKLSDFHYYALGRAFLTLSIITMTNYYYYSTFGKGVLQLYTNIVPCNLLIQHFQVPQYTLEDPGTLLEDVRESKKQKKDQWLICEYNEDGEDEVKALSPLFDNAIKERPQMIESFGKWIDFFQRKVVHKKRVVREIGNDGRSRKIEKTRKDITYNSNFLFDAWIECRNGIKLLEEKFNSIGKDTENSGKKELDYVKETYGVLNEMEKNWRLPIENKYVLLSGERVLPLDDETRKRLRFLKKKLEENKMANERKLSNEEIKEKIRNYLSILKTWTQDQLGEFIYPIYREYAINEFRRALSEIDGESNIYHMEDFEEPFIHK